MNDEKFEKILNLMNLPQTVRFLNVSIQEGIENSTVLFVLSASKSPDWALIDIS